MIDLTEFLDAYSAREWAPGTTDCCLMLADWAVAKGLADAAAHLRGTYDSEAGFWALVDAAGGLWPIVGDCVAVVGGRRVNKPVVGAVAVIGSMTSARRQWGAIWDGAVWRVRDASGVIAVSAPAIAIWEI